MKKTVLITGSSSGFGRLTAKKFQQEGWNVIATMRSPEKETELNELKNVLVSKLDVTNAKDIERVVSEGVLKFGSIHALVNNAGYGGHALFEQFSEASIRAMYETNVFGLMNVTRAVLPIMRKQTEGRIINITSLGGIIAGPTVSIYSSTKFAIEGFTEGLAQELKPLNISAKTIAPGSFGTRFIANCDNAVGGGDDQVNQYAQKLNTHMEEVRKNMRSQGATEPNPQDVTDKIFECVTQDTPIHNIVGADAEIMLGMKNSMPQQDFLDKISAMLLPKEL
ncbi:MAG: SDR family oxidoreductase, partial [Ostreibacterium sp.]